MGVLPLEFQSGTNRLTLGLDGSETFDVIGERTPRAVLTLRIRHKNGETASVPVKCRLDTAEKSRSTKPAACCSASRKTPGRTEDPLRTT